MADFIRIPWLEDEIILALDLYVSDGALDDSHPDVIELSQLPRSLPLHPVDARNQARFRNPNGVTLKLKNFLALDPNYPGAGTGSVSKLDKQLFNLYIGQPEPLKEVAEKIRADVDLFPSEPAEDEDDVPAPEGRLLYRQHAWRERNRGQRNRKVKDALKRDGRLLCEACGLEFGEFYGEVGAGYIEVHHRQPLHVSGPCRPVLAISPWSAPTATAFSIAILLRPLRDWHKSSQPGRDLEAFRPSAFRVVRRTLAGLRKVRQ